MDNTTKTEITQEQFQRVALEAAAFAVKMGRKTIDGESVMCMLSYLNTCQMSQAERTAVLGHAFDIFAGAVRRESD